MTNLDAALERLRLEIVAWFENARRRAAQWDLPEYAEDQ